MALTFGEARKLVAQYAGRGGKCESSEDVRLFLHEVLQHMLLSGQHGGLRIFTFNAVRGCITLPYELEVPLKVKINGAIGSVWQTWYEFSTSTILEGVDCHDAGNALVDDPNLYPTVYDLPDCGAKVGVQADCAQSVDSYIIVAGTDVWGRPVFVPHKGIEMGGEYLTVKKGALNYTQTVFKEISSIYINNISGYVSLWWVTTDASTKGFLSEYGPHDKSPAYRRVRLSVNCSDCARVSILGKIRLKQYYADSDRIPFDNIVALKTSAQSRNANDNNDNQTSQFKDSYLRDIINRENEFKTPNNGRPVEVYAPTSSGSIRGIINATPGWLRGGFRNRGWW